jgi:hypothetical protein
MGDKNECPICLETVNTKVRINCYVCMTCKQKMHASCELEWNQNRNRIDDIIICPICNQNSIAFCHSPNTDINRDIKLELAENTDRSSGGKRRKKRKTRRTKKRSTKKIRTRRTK